MNNSVDRASTSVTGKPQFDEIVQLEQLRFCTSQAFVNVIKLANYLVLFRNRRQRNYSIF